MAGVIRFHPQYLHIPVVFLSTEAHVDQQLAALRTGGDDFLTKPINDAHLVEAVHIRVLRARRVNELISHDSLTGLLKHSAIREQVALEYGRSPSSKNNFCYAIVDIDNFKQINDIYAHLQGDRVINSLARMLKARVRSGDVLGRYGGEEFGVILLDCEIDDARVLLNELGNDFAAQVFTENGRSYHVTFSAGVAHSSQFDCSDELINAADSALHEAKRQGKNCVRITVDKVRNI
ncbi:MAG: diguanylate cyclase (GGDEF)-like protein [Lentisphaeria bacterium]